MLFLSFMQSFDLLTPLKTTLIIPRRKGKKCGFAPFQPTFHFVNVHLLSNFCHAKSFTSPLFTGMSAQRTGVSRTVTNKLPWKGK